jgi:pectate lyase
VIVFHVAVTAAGGYARPTTPTSPSARRPPPAVPLRSSKSRFAKFFLLLLAASLLSLPRAHIAGAQSYQGFGSTTPGGSGGAVVRVTNLNNSGPGSLREALSAGNRTVVFDVGGEISLTSAIRVAGAFITVDGFAAPSPGITLRGAGLSIHGSRLRDAPKRKEPKRPSSKGVGLSPDGAHDILIRGIRIRDASATADTDGITIAFGAYNIIIDHVSVHGSRDGNIDVTFGSHDVTVSWSILAEPAGTQKNMLIKFDSPRITLHHNIFVSSRQRNPQVSIDDAGTPATDTTLDMRNNLVGAWGTGYGTMVWHGARANVVNNYYSSSKKAISVSSARAHVQGNVSADNVDIDRQGNEMRPFPAPPVDTQDACAAAHLVLANAGVLPRDSIDQRYLSKITIASCSSPPPTIAVSPDSPSSGATPTGPDPPGGERSSTTEP